MIPGLDLGAKGYLIDLDGTLVSGGVLLPGARALLDAVAGRFAIVSNDAEHRPDDLVALLARLGVAVPPDRVVLAGAVALEILAVERPGARALLLMSEPLRDLAHSLGLVPANEDAEVVVVGRDRSFTYASLAKAASAMRRGAALVVANPDGSHPGRGGDPVPETGALAAAILSCAGNLPYRVIGKPQAPLYLRALASLGAAPGEAVMIGDNPDTDGAGAEALGIRFLRVGEGR